MTLIRDVGKKRVGSHLPQSRKRIVRHYVFCFSGCLSHSWIVSAWPTAYAFSFKFSLLEPIQCCARQVGPCMTNLNVTLTPVRVVYDPDKPWPFFHFWRHQFWPKLVQYHLYPTAARRKGLTTNTQIRVISLMEPEISTKMLKKLSEKLGAKLPATTRDCSMVKIACLDDAFLEVCFSCKQAQ